MSGGATSGRWPTNEAILGVPTSPSRTAWRNVTRSGANRNSWPTRADDAGPAGLVEEALGLAGRGGEGLLHQDVTAGGDRFPRQLGVRGRRGGDHDDVGVRQLQSLGERAAGRLDAGALGPAGRPLAIAPDQGHDVEARGPCRGHVDATSEPGADDDDAGRPPGHPPRASIRAPRFTLVAALRGRESTISTDFGTL